MTDTIFDFQVAGKSIPVTQFEITGGSYGSTGHVSATTSYTALFASNIDLFELVASAPGQTEVSIVAQQSAEQPPRQQTQSGPPHPNQTKIFGGEYLNTSWDVDNDVVTIKARDWSGVLVDQKRVLTKIGKAIEAALRPLAPGRVTATGISSENQKVGDIVTAIAEEFGFNPILNLSDGKGNPTVGTLYGSSDQVFMPLPQSLWNILNQLARDTGYVVYVTPNKDLVFGEPGAGLSTIKLCHKVFPVPEGNIPCKGLKVEHHPRRNSTFRVVIMSYDRSQAKAVIGRATYVGPNYAGAHGLDAGLASGPAATMADAAIAKLDATVNKVALYSFHIDGLSQQQADLRAASMAIDIAKRELLLTAAVDGLPSILPTQQVQLEVSGGKSYIPPQFLAPTYYVSTYSHRFVLPTDAAGHHTDQGWMTHFTALNIPTEALAKETEG